MLHLHHHHYHHRLLLLSCSSNIFMASKYFLRPAPHNPPHTLLPTISFFSTNQLRPLQQQQQHYNFSPKPISISLNLSNQNSRFSTSAAVSNLVPVEEQSSEEEVTKNRLTLKQQLEKMGISCNCKPGTYSRLRCHQCGGGDTKEKSLSVFITADGSTALWNCFRAKCGANGNLKASGNGRASSAKVSPRIETSKTKRHITEESIGLEPLSGELIAYFAERMISAETLRRNSVMQKPGDEVAIAFTYKRNGELVSCKYRDINKRFWQEKETEKVLYGLDDIKGATDIIIVEGEIDKLSMEEAGFRNCVSVPDGAPCKVSDKDIPPEDEDKKYKYLWNCKEYLDKASRIILATDADQPGQALAEELARRLGKERCWRVRWPKKNNADVCKDANEVLMCLGSHALRKVIDQAELYPIRGLFTFRDFFDEIDAYYHCSMGYELGVSTGWRGLDDFYKIVPGELTVVTGVPNSGKSEWIDALLCNINEKEGWKFALCSMENKVREHARKLLEKHTKRPFFGASYAESVERMSPEELEEGKKWLSNTFHLIRCEDDSLPSVKWVLELAKAAVLRYGVRGLVIDPYNELDHQRPPNQTETEYVSQMLTKIKRFAQHHSCHVWFVAHPRQLHQWVGGPPNLYDISGSAHFINKCDNGIVVHRNRDAERGPVDQVEIYVRKVRNKVVGKIGDAKLSYDRVTGTFQDPDERGRV